MITQALALYGAFRLYRDFLDKKGKSPKARASTIATDKIIELLQNDPEGWEIQEYCLVKMGEHSWNKLRLWRVGLPILDTCIHEMPKGSRPRLTLYDKFRLWRAMQPVIALCKERATESLISDLANLK